MGYRIRWGVDDPGPNTDTVDIDTCRLGMFEEVYRLLLEQENDNGCVVPRDPDRVEQMCRVHVAVAHLPKNLAHRYIRGKILDLNCLEHVTCFRGRDVANSEWIPIGQHAVLLPMDVAVPNLMDQLLFLGARIAVCIDRR